MRSSSFFYTDDPTGRLPCITRGSPALTPPRACAPPAASEFIQPRYFQFSSLVGHVPHTGGFWRNNGKFVSEIVLHIHRYRYLSQGTRPGALEQVPHGRAAAALRARPVQQAGGCCASGGHAEREPTEAELIRAFFEERGRDTVRGPTGRGSATIAAWGPRRCSSAPLSGQLPTDEAQAHIQNAC
ncbi:unnamed protein product [Prorocentrum cordatum]|uniref:Uncharacterized protein n=1 Tax=Prorocentrum cordatum TaxID=2364126 RepID=A0ABN9YCT7_9DINO|nr:unnamed protein product [Polarella glacialis]